MPFDVLVDGCGDVGHVPHQFRDLRGYGPGGAPAAPDQPEQHGHGREDDAEAGDEQREPLVGGHSSVAIS